MAAEPCRLASEARDAFRRSRRVFAMKRSTQMHKTLTITGLALAAGLGVLLVASTASAQEPGAGGAGVKSSDQDGGYGYEFSDDPLSAGGFGPTDATIRVRPGPVRTTLIRPRTSFVPEMLKSVENL
jgi:hypothetical protein